MAAAERPKFPAARSHSLLGTFRMAQLAAPVQRREMAVAGRLIKHGIAPRRFAECFRIGLLLDVESVEAGAQHEDELVAQHLTGGAQLAVKAVTLAQQASLRIGAAIAERREYQRDQRETIEIRHEI